MTTLYDYWRSTASYRVRIALGLAGEAYDSLPIDLVAGAQKSSEHLTRNPQGLVPMLEIDGLQLTQSLAIVEYLDETRELGLLPADPAGRARVRALGHAIAMEIHPDLQSSGRTPCSRRVRRCGHDGRVDAGLHWAGAGGIRAHA